MAKRIFIDGSSGTTGLRIHERIGARNDLEIVSISDELRKNSAEKKRIMNSCDAVFLCLPDDAARESVALIDNPATIVIDTSTAHRTNPDFAYGFAELGSDFREKIARSNRIAVPGCHASGFVGLVYPLVKAGIIPKNAHLCCHSITGYSGGGKKMIAEYETDDRNPLLDAPRQYALGQLHKHLKEMKGITGLELAPVFCPIVAPFYSGMEVTVPLFADEINGSIDDIRSVYAERYSSGLVKYAADADEGGFMSAAALSHKDTMQIAVSGCDERILLIARFDNLGKGASGAAVQCLNIAFGMDEATGLEL